MLNIKIRTAIIISPHRRIPRNLTQSLILIIQGGYTHFRPISQRTRQIQGRRKLRKFRMYLQVHIKYLRVPTGTSHKTPSSVTHYITQEIHRICTTDISQKGQHSLTGATARSNEGSACGTPTLERSKGKDRDTGAHAETRHRPLPEPSMLSNNSHRHTSTTASPTIPLMDLPQRMKAGMGPSHPTIQLIPTHKTTTTTQRERLRTPKHGFFRLTPYTPVPLNAIAPSGCSRPRSTTCELQTSLIEGDHSHLPPHGGP
jgi:hypothetical protein